MIAFEVRALTPGQWSKEQWGATEYYIYIPQSHNSTQQASLMLNLHGCAQKAEDLVRDGNWESAAEQNEMIVVIPKVPNGGVLFGCWDYYGKNHSETGRHNKPVIELTEHLLRSSRENILGIDPKQVYVSGLSSGGAQAFVLSCLRPDLYAGVGLNSSPLLGTTASEVQRPQMTAEGAANLCIQLAGAHASHFRTQLASIVLGDKDYIVNTQHSVLSAQALDIIYKTTNKIDLDRSELTGANTEGSGWLLLDAKSSPHISFFINKGLGHAWPSGRGTGNGNFINAQSINYPSYLGKFFKENRLR